MAKCVTRKLQWRSRVWVMVAASGFGLGCASQSDDAKRQLESLNERILILQNDRDRLVERVDALEQHHDPALPAPVAVTPTRPTLKIVRLEPQTPDQETSDQQAVADEANTNRGSEQTPIVESSEQQNTTPIEPTQRVVLYGEGKVSGVREHANQELP
jgi:hypothetical protein